MREPLVIYHANCTDGFAAAWVVGKRFDFNVQLYPATYDELMPALAELRDRQVFVVDFSYPRQDLDVMQDNCNQLTVLDHHKTAEEALRGAPYAVFDMNKSGCGLTWDYLFPDKPRPTFIDYVEDRDLWKFELPESRKIGLYLSAVECTFVDYNFLESCDSLDLEVAANSVKYYVDYMCRDAIKRSNLTRMFQHKARVINSAYIGISEMLNALLELGDCDIAVGWYVKDETARVSLRSKEVDVSQIAKGFGGGGHHKSAGFSVDIDSYVLEQLLENT